MSLINETVQEFTQQVAEQKGNWIAQQAQAAQQVGNNSLASCPSCMTDVVGCNVKLFIIIVEMAIIMMAYYYSAKPEKKFRLFGRERSYEWAFLKLMAMWPMTAIIILGILTMGA